MKQLKGRRRPVQNRKFNVVNTGIAFRGCAVALLVPGHIPPEQVVQGFVQSQNILIEKARELSVKDMFELQVKAAAEIQ
jgi:hypothetical protein